MVGATVVGMEATKTPRSVGDRVRGARAAARLTQTEAATAAGLSTSAYARREAGVVRFTVEEITKLAEALGADLAGLAGGDA